MLNNLKEEAQFIATQGDYYLYHEFLEAENNPLYFHEFMREASNHNLQYISDAHLHYMYIGRFNAFAQEELQNIKDIHRVEQYSDFFLTSALKPAQDYSAAQIADSTNIKFKSDTVSVTLSQPVIKQAMVLLNYRRGKPLAFKEMVSLTATTLGVDSNKVSAILIEQSTLIDLLMCGALNIYSDGSINTLEVSEKPNACPLARLQASQDQFIANCLHEFMKLNSIDSLLLKKLDGNQWSQNQWG